MYSVVKTYGHDTGLSCVFRQHRAIGHSHCAYLHGYAIGVRLEFRSEERDERGWVVDFGGLKSLKAAIADMFDHRLLVAEDDPDIEEILDLGKKGLATVRVVEEIGCEAFAKLIDSLAREKLPAAVYGKLYSVTVSEHSGNAATYYRNQK